MGLLDRIKKFTESDDYEEDTGNYDEYTEETTTKAPSVRSTGSTYASEPYSARTGNRVVNINATAQLQVVLVKPDTFDNAREIADHLKDKKTVVINLEQTPKEIARRLLDFLSGVAYAFQGKIQKVANNTFLITPYNVGIMGDIIDELESNGLYF
ncbi:MAG: cell division protein SepF [Oscillospiraceae bacterium]|nr:cell division protein SepF [Oscillospiraceae bacterium]